jgi:cytoskeletal protein RodZ
MPFKTKKIVSSDTVGSRLARARKKLKLTIEQVEEKTKVRSKYLRAIEADDWKSFPSRIYVLGFVRRYSEALGLDSREVLSEFKRQFDNFTLSRELETISKRKVHSQQGIIITPKLIYTILAITLVVSVVGYMAYAVSKFSKPPTIEISSPKEEAVSEQNIVIEGKTTPNAIIEINGQAANVEDDGSFVQKVQLEEGVNIFEIKAKSRLGKEKAKIIRVLYQPAQSNQPQAAVAPSPTATASV